MTISAVALFSLVRPVGRKEPDARWTLAWKFSLHPPVEALHCSVANRGIVDSPNDWQDFALKIYGAALCSQVRHAAGKEFSLHRIFDKQYWWTQAFEMIFDLCPLSLCSCSL